MPKEVNTPSVIALWLFPVNAPLKQISPKEEQWASSLSSRRSREFRHSRGYLRQALSDLWKVKALDIPLTARPGRPPELSEGWGFVSISHCRDALLVGWSKSPLGIDIERIDRSFSANHIASRYFSDKEQQQISKLHGDNLRIKVLEKWLIKEAAIKWQKGSLANDLVHWHSREELGIIEHHSLKVRLSSMNLRHSHWAIAVASDFSNAANPTMLCIN